MVAYYISYGDEPPRRFPWRILLAIFAALSLIGIVIAVRWRWPSDGEESLAANRPDAVPFAAAVPAVFAPTPTPCTWLTSAAASPKAGIWRP